MARLCTKGILYRGHVARRPAVSLWRSGFFLRGNPRLTAAQPVVTRPLPSDNLTMGVGLLFCQLLMITRNRGAPPPEAGRFSV
jgi:hypothetical protein